MTEKDTDMLKHLAEKVMGYLVPAVQPYSDCFVVWKSRDSEYSTFDPLTDANAALAVLARTADCAKLRHWGGALWSGRVARQQGRCWVDEVAPTDFCTAACLAAARATGWKGD